MRSRSQASLCLFHKVSVDQGVPPCLEHDRLKLGELRRPQGGCRVPYFALCGERVPSWAYPTERGWVLQVNRKWVLTFRVPHIDRRTSPLIAAVGQHWVCRASSSVMLPIGGLSVMVVDAGSSPPPATKPKPTFSESQHFWLHKLQITIFNAHVGICCY